jgi:hypothetical protein
MLEDDAVDVAACVGDAAAIEPGNGVVCRAQTR